MTNPQESLVPDELASLGQPQQVHEARVISTSLVKAEDLHVAPVITWWNTRNLWSDRAAPADLLVRLDGNRLYHVMGGEDEREGGALLYFGLRQPIAIAGADREYPSPVRFLDEARKHAGVHVDIEKPFWWDVPVWLATRETDTIGIANNHMARSKMYANEAWGKARDAERLPAPLGNGYWTQELYYQILNCGLRIAPSAGSASGVLPNPVGYNRVYVHLDGELTYERWFEGLRVGRSFVTNGPLLRLRAGGPLSEPRFCGCAPGRDRNFWRPGGTRPRRIAGNHPRRTSRTTSRRCGVRQDRHARQIDVRVERVVSRPRRRRQSRHISFCLDGSLVRGSGRSETAREPQFGDVLPRLDRRADRTGQNRRSAEESRSARTAPPGAGLLGRAG